MEIIVGFWIVCGIVGAIIGSAKNAGPAGFALGLLLGPLGVIAAFILDNRRKCPQCKGRVDDGAQICQHCHSAIVQLGRGSRKGAKPDSTTADDDHDQEQVHFKCKQCRTALTWPAADAGNKILCSECGVPTIVPDYSGAASTSGRNLRTCPDCGGQVSRRASDCPHCGCPLVAP